MTAESTPPDLLYESLLELCLDNKQYFSQFQDNKSQKLYNAFVTLEERIENLLPLLNEFREIAPTYDFRNVPYNGYRSFISTVDKLSCTCLRVCHSVCEHRNSLFFQRLHYVRELESCSQVYSSLNSCFQLLEFLRNAADPGHLFLDKIDSIRDIQKIVDKVDIKAFFGKLIGFQFGGSTQPVIKTVAIMMSAFAEYYFNDKNMLFCAAMCSQFFANPDLRAERISQVTAYRTATVDFCKTFWNISESEILKKLNVMFQPTHFVNQMIELAPEPLKYMLDENSSIDIPIPSAHTGLKPLNVRLISASKRQGMNVKNSTSLLPPSEWFVFHLHGGGFISQTSESHQIYLKSWTLWTGAPILSVDYSLAPEAPYPRALEEVLYAYVWALNNLSILGTTAKRIVFAGDSAGGNLCIGLILKCIEMNIRKPDGLFVAYVPTVLQFYPSPSRFLGLLDPLLSFGFMLCCIKAYTHNGRVRPCCQKVNFEEGSEENGSFDDAEVEENESCDDSFKDITPPSFSEITSNFDQNSPASDIVIDDQQNADENSLPVKYKNIIKGYVSNLREKFGSKCESCVARGSNPTDEIFIDQLILDADDDMFLSPIMASDNHFKKFPPTAILSVEMDPCLDDGVILAKKLDRLHKKVHLDVLKGLMHGFLNVSLSSKDAFNGSVLCAQRIKELFTNTLPCNR